MVLKTKEKKENVNKKATGLGVKKTEKKKKKSKKEKKVTFSSEQSESLEDMIAKARSQVDSDEQEPIGEQSTLVENDPDNQDEFAEEIEEEITDEALHSKLLKGLGVEQKKRKVKEKILPVEPTDKEIEGQVTLKDLISSANKSEGLKSVEQLLDTAGDTKTIEEPLPRFQAEQVEREVNYGKSKKEVSKWLPLVKRNRETTHMSYPLYHTQKTQGREDISDFASKKQKATTALEEEVYEVLAAEAHVVERPDHFLTAAEEQSLEELNAEEAETRRQELGKMRALLSYQEEKFRRKRKIKSKKYHRVLKKEKQKKEEKTLSDALKANPDVAVEEQDKADYLRALERISQKHKVGGRWNKNLLHKNIKDPDVKAAMNEQRQHRAKLMEKQDISESEDEVELVEADTPAADTTAAEKVLPQEPFEVDPSNPWLMVGSALSGETDLPEAEPTLQSTEETDKETDVASTEKSDVAEDSEQQAEEDGSSSSPEDEQPGEVEKEKSEQKAKPPPLDPPTLDQEALVDMAFANDDVVAQFVEEKQKLVDDEAGKDLDVTLPGWGSWAGAGVKEKPKKKVIKAAPPKNPRKDAALEHVIINTKKNRKLDQHLVRHLPHPYKSRSVFEREMRQPIGPQWNSVRSFRNMIKPSETVLDGHVIHPMTAPKGFDKVVIKGRRKELK